MIQQSTLGRRLLAALPRVTVDARHTRVTKLYTAFSSGGQTACTRKWTLIPMHSAAERSFVAKNFPLGRQTLIESPCLQSEINSVSSEASSGSLYDNWCLTLAAISPVRYSSCSLVSVSKNRMGNNVETIYRCRD